MKIMSSSLARHHANSPTHPRRRHGLQGLDRGQGLARKLMGAAVQHGMARPGLCVLQLEVTQGNTSVLRLFQSLGFESFGLESMAVLTAKGYCSKVHMWLDLALGKKQS
jgi:L-amino acid N-acyltransferase YncA